MFNELTALGIFHTAISILPIPLGLIAFFRDGKIDLGNTLGKAYLITMLIGTITAFGIFRTGSFSAGHGLSVVTLLVLLAGMFATRMHWLGRGASYVQTTSLTTSYLMLMIFTTTETLTRLPVNHPFAANADAPELLPVRLLLLLIFAVGLNYQIAYLRATKLLSA